LYFGQNIKVIRKVRKRWHQNTLATFLSLGHLIPSLSISDPDLIKSHDFADNSQQGKKHQMKLSPTGHDFTDNSIVSTPTEMRTLRRLEVNH
jgi:hypothetical protein